VDRSSSVSLLQLLVVVVPCHLASVARCRALSPRNPLPPPSSVNGAGATADGAMDYGIVVVHVDKAQALSGPETYVS
jgi:hypothetical protein